MSLNLINPEQWPNESGIGTSNPLVARERHAGGCCMSDFMKVGLNDFIQLSTQYL